MGNLSRGGFNRKDVNADDHDFDFASKLTPVGIYQPKEKDLTLYMVRSNATSDCYADIIESWFRAKQIEGAKIKRLVVNLDNGPEQNSRRTQFMSRMQDFANTAGIEVHLAYYPPYHSKYNPVERTFGALEKHWHGEILDTEEKVIGYAKSMKWAGKVPAVKLVDKIYQTGVKVAKRVMKKINAGFDRKQGIENWSVIIRPRLDSG